MFGVKYSNMKNALIQTTTITLLTAGLCLSGLLAPATAGSFTNSYIPPEIAYANDLNQKVSVNQRVNINQASMPELMSLPGIDENMALKIMRIRPVEDVKDFYKMPWVPRRDARLLIENIQSLIAF